MFAKAATVGHGEYSGGVRAERRDTFEWLFGSTGIGGSRRRQQRLLPQIEGLNMSKRIEQSRRHGHWDPRYAPKLAVPQDGRVSLVTPRNSPTRPEERSTAKGVTKVAFRHELCDTHGNYVGTFVTEIEPWQIGDAFTAGDGRALRITDIAASERSCERPTYNDRWKVEPSEAAAVVIPAAETGERL